jgi:LacI family transcriptional regulator
MDEAPTSEQEANDETGRRRAPTIVDVANAAGVAIGTVSRFINGQPVRASNREQIEAAINRLGYQRNALAAAMKRDVTNVIGFMLPSLSEFHGAVLQYVSRKMRAQGRAVLSFFHDVDSRSVAEGLEFFAAQRVDCLVIDGLESEAARIRSVVERQIPVVLYDNDIPGVVVDRVYSNNRDASRRATSHLLDIGHERIGIVTGHTRDYTARERLAGYIDALKERDIQIDEDLIVSGQWSEQGGHQAMRQILALDHPPTAVFSCNYNMTVGSLALFREIGLRLPDDLSLISFDDVPLFRLHETGITAIAQPTELIADSIVGLLLTRLDNRTSHAPYSTLLLDCDIILRGSTRRPRIS